LDLLQRPPGNSPERTQVGKFRAVHPAHQGCSQPVSKYLLGKHGSLFAIAQSAATDNQLGSSFFNGLQEHFHFFRMIGIIGSGNVGANTAFFLAEKGVDHVTLCDIQEGLAQGKALDMMEAAPIRGYRTSIQGTDDPDAVLNADIIIITAGAVRKPGMDRDALFQENKDLAERPGL